MPLFRFTIQSEPKICFLAFNLPIYQFTNLLGLSQRMVRTFLWYAQTNRRRYRRGLLCLICSSGKLEEVRSGVLYKEPNVFFVINMLYY